MTDEEKKAIAIFKSYINAIETFGTIDYKCINNLYEPAITLLNLITKLQKENEEKDKQIDLILNEQIQDGYLVNFNNLEEAREYYNKLAKEKEE